MEYYLHLSLKFTLSLPASPYTGGVAAHLPLSAAGEYWRRRERHRAFSDSLGHAPGIEAVWARQEETPMSVFEAAAEVKAFLEDVYIDKQRISGYLHGIPSRHISHVSGHFNGCY